MIALNAALAPLPPAWRAMHNDFAASAHRPFVGAFLDDLGRRFDWATPAEVFAAAAAEAGRPSEVVNWYAEALAAGDTQANGE